MEFETVERCGRVYVVKNGVESATFVRRSENGLLWVIMIPHQNYVANTLNETLKIIALHMDTWYTSAQAAERLVELNAYDSPPSVHTMSNLARAGAFPGAFKLRGKGGGGSGGQGGEWRIPGSGLAEHAKRRKEQ